MHERYLTRREIAVVRGFRAVGRGPRFENFEHGRSARVRYRRTDVLALMRSGGCEAAALNSDQPDGAISKTRTGER
jgi:hypothetical protein